jgi:O-succinylbenzoate synthase
MIRIEQIICRIVELDMVAAFKTASGAVIKKQALLLELFDQSGLSVFSECVALETPHYLPETVDTSFASLAQNLIPAVLHQSFDSPQQLTHLLLKQDDCPPMALAALDMGAWAIKATNQNQSLAHCLGATKTAVDCGVVIGMSDSLQHVRSLVTKERDRGYKKIKLKISPGCDYDYLAAVRSDHGNDIQLVVDANGSYDVNDMDALIALDAFDLLMIEQPFDRNNIDAHQQLQARMNTHMCLDESIRSIDTLQRVIELDAARVINLKPGRVGGLTILLEMMAICERHSIPVWVGGMLETGVGRAYNVAVAALDQMAFPGDLSPSDRYFSRDIIDPDWAMSDGQLLVPNEVGIGVSVDRDYLDRSTIFKQTFS